MEKGKFIVVDGIRTRYFEKGKGDALILVHGGQFGSVYSADSWSRNIEGLSKYFHVFAIDRLGMGCTDNPKRDKDYTMEASMQHVYGFLKAKQIKNAHLAGHSRGGYLVTRLALEYPEHVKTLIIVDSSTMAPDDPASPSNAFYEKLDREEPPIPTRESVRREPDAQSYSKKHVTKDFVEAMYKIAVQPKMLEAHRKMKKLINSVFLPDLNKRKTQALEAIKAGGLKVPTLVMWGFNDLSAPLFLGLNLVNLLCANASNVQLHVLNQAGHYCFREQPTAFNKVIAGFANAL